MSIMNRTDTIWITDPSTNSFSDDYKILHQLGTPGSYGKAFRCRRKSDGKTFAVKEISKTKIYASSPSSERRNSILKTMETEILVMQRLNHPYIVRMHGTYETKHKLHIIMDECKGGELFDRIKSKKRYCERDAKPVIRMICEALFYMHDKHSVVHCDLKPDNILFADKSETSNIKIIDFGMSKVLQRLHALGNPYYIAPEVLKRSSTHAADMWSVGVKPGVQIKKGFNPIIKKGYGPCFPTNCRSLLMKTDVAKRLTAKEALQHSWLVDGEQIIDEVDLDQDGTIDHDYKECLRALHPDFSKKKLPGHGIIGSADALDAHAVEDYVQMIEREQRECFAEDLNEIMKEGWMRKEGGLIKTWKRRYFVLRNGGAVSYYRDETKEDARGAFSCKELDELCFMSWGKSNDKRYGIKVNTVSRNWKFVCQNNQEREEWMKCFQTVCVNRQRPIDQDKS
eukprot:794392_1